MAVDAVMSMMGTGLGDAVVEVVYRVVLAHASHIGADWHVGSFEQSSVGIPHVVGEVPWWSTLSCRWWVSASAMQ